VRIVDVVREPNGDAAVVRAAQRSADDRDEVVRKVQVVDRDVERVLRGGEEAGQRIRGVDGRLAAVDQCADFDLSLALYSRFAAW
jgi:hypothetical protein